MQKASLVQQTHQHLSSQQIQYLRLVAQSNMELNSAIDEALTDNPVLEEVSSPSDSSVELDGVALESTKVPLGGAYQRRGMESEYAPAARQALRDDTLYEQLRWLKLNKKEHQIGTYLIGSLDEHGYLRTPLSSLCDDLLVSEHVRSTPEEVEQVLAKIQQLEPAGIGARNLQECLRIQLEALPATPVQAHALWIIQHAFQDFVHKRYVQLQKQLGVRTDELKAAIQLITTRNPKPSALSRGHSPPQTIFADFSIQTNPKGQLKAVIQRLPRRIGLNKRYINEIENALNKAQSSAQEKKETLRFIRHKKEEAKQFVSALQQRATTLTQVAQTIIDKQKSFILHLDKSYLSPMQLKDVAQELNIEASTLSRIVNNKYITLPNKTNMCLREFFSQAVHTSTGAVSQKRLHSQLMQLIENENKQQPFTDDELQQKLKAIGYALARRTVAKYRIQLGIPDSRLRKSIA